MIKNLEFALGLVMTAGIYVPLYKRMFKRKHTRDFSKPSSWFVFLAQVNNFFLATAEHAHYLTVWYVIQSLLCAIQLTLLYRYWETQEPRLRENR